MSAAVTEGKGYRKGNKEGGMKLEFIDIRRAYFQANAVRDVFVELPEEDAEEGMCGMLIRAMYGTRDAAQNWEKAYSEFMMERGFDIGVASPCVFWHRERGIRAVVHGDDFTMLGWEEDLDWFRKEIQERFEVKIKGRIGPGKEDMKSMRVLNRIVEWTEGGITYEADQRHAEIIVRDLGLKE
jgi:hypothetical protein